jgi:tetratricopeptide (TPR) repeat protein
MQPLTGLRPAIFLVFLAWLALAPVAGRAGQDSNLLKQAQTSEDQQNYRAAEDLYRKFLASDPDNLEALKHLGILEQTDVKLDDSIEHFKRVVTYQPEYPQVNSYLGRSYYAQQNNKDSKGVENSHGTPGC